MANNINDQMNLDGYDPADAVAIRAAIAELNEPPAAPQAQPAEPEERAPRRMPFNREVIEPAPVAGSIGYLQNEIRKKAVITEDCPDIDTPDMLKVPLYDYQRRSVQRALDLVTKPVVVSASLLKHNEITVTSSAVKLADPFGSGKTLMSLAIIAHMPMPPPYYSICTTELVDTSFEPRGLQHYMKKDKQSRESVVYRKPSGVFRFAVYVVGPQVFVQFFNAIKQFTKFTVFAIHDVHSLSSFYKIYKSGLAENYDIILVKNGEVTSNFKLDDEPEDESCVINNILIRMFRGKSCSWAVYDDYDTSKCPSSAREIPSLAQLYISTTTDNKLDKRYNSNRVFYRSGSDESAKPIEQRSHTPYVLHANYDRIWLTLFNVRNDTKLVEQSLKLPKFKTHLSICHGGGEMYVDLIKRMNLDNNESLLEVLNAGAVKSAGSIIGMANPNSIADIFQRVLDKQFGLYRHNCLMIEAVDRFVEKCNARDYTVAQYLRIPTMRRHIINIVEQWEASPSAREMPQIVLGERFSATDAQTCAELRNEYIAMKDEHSKPLQKIREILQDNDCQVCRVELEEIVILKCCNIVICGICVKSVLKNMHTSTANHEQWMYGKCPNCKAEVRSNQDVIYITKGFDINAILNETGIEKEEKPEPEVSESSDERDDTKIATLYNIIQGKIPANSALCTLDTPNLIQGEEYVPVPDDVPRKILVFASYSETLDEIEKFFEKKRIPNVYKLQGTVRQLHNMVSKFKEETSNAVMLVNSSAICAGINLQFATTCITYHRLNNLSITAQINGRFQRVGRKYSCDFHHLRYENERERGFELADRRSAS